MTKLTAKWYPESIPALLSEANGLYWKSIKDKKGVKGVKGKTVARICATTRVEAEALATHICMVHNLSIIKTKQ